ncbi:hypothetical protein G9F73_014725 [Clostridium estertheticum]|uniref:hypothetical protein n=1 Tax=Clostridium estertheticum TaxID=238834 RepID=UPI0013EED3BA|nr:hypothetical protein [Clostridium estertheticum]MBZ9609055.1 hypothetical protein [Clostridium estertheticum]
MIQLYFGKIESIISSICIIAFIIYVGWIFTHRDIYNKWGKASLILLIFGTFMSAMAGTRDGIGLAGGFSPNGILFISLCVLGGLAFLLGFISLICKFMGRTAFFKVSFYALSLIIIIKIVIVESNRIAEFLAK